MCERMALTHDGSGVGYPDDMKCEGELYYRWVCEFDDMRWFGSLYGTPTGCKYSSISKSEGIKRLIVNVF
jgi:hypothetical protein